MHHLIIIIVILLLGASGFICISIVVLYICVELVKRVVTSGDLYRERPWRNLGATIFNKYLQSALLPAGRIFFFYDPHPVHPVVRKGGGVTRVKCCLTGFIESFILK